MHPLAFSMRNFLQPINTLVLLAFVFLTAGCGQDHGSAGIGLPDTGPLKCTTGEMPLDGGGCQPAGLPPGQTAGLPRDMPCPPGEMPLDGGGCQPAGVPPEACDQGFEPDGQAGCNPILPEGLCAPGQIAIPGDTECREMAPCGDGDYGLIPVDATTQYVNAAYPGNDSDGTRPKPWKRIQDGIDRARRGAIVAVAAGRYTEDLVIQNKPVRLWGRCPALVEVVGAGTATATLAVLRGGASRSEVHALAITGPKVGFGTSGASEVIVDQLWIHDTMDWGIRVDDLLGATSFTMSASLIEATEEIGVVIDGSDATIEATVVRDTQRRSDGIGGRGIEVGRGPESHERGMLTLRTSVLEQNHEVGVFVTGSGATVEATVVRATQPRSDGSGGRGIEVAGDSVLHERGMLTLRASVLEQNHDVGVFVDGSDATIESTVVRATQPRSDGSGGRGIHIQDDITTHERGMLTLRTSLLEQNHNVGMLIQGSDATIEATVVRATLPNSNGPEGAGIAVGENTSSRERGTLSLRTSLIDQNNNVGVQIQGADAIIGATVVRATQAYSDETEAMGIELIGIEDAPKRATLMLSTSLLEQNFGIGVLVQSSDATIEETIVRATQPGSDRSLSRGIVVQSQGVTIQGASTARERATLTLRTSLLEQNQGVGVSVVGSDATIEATVVRATQPKKDGTKGRGIAVEDEQMTQARGKLTLRTSLLEQNHEIGAVIINSDATIEATVVRATRSTSDGILGDGISVSSHGAPTSATITWTKVEANARAGISNFDAAVVLVSSTVQCNRFDLDGEEVVEGQPFTFDGSKGNLCGCDDDPDPTCPVVSASLSPPDAISPIRSQQ